METYDLVVIGGGSAGLTAATGAVEIGSNGCISRAQRTFWRTMPLYRLCPV